MEKGGLGRLGDGVLNGMSHWHHQRETPHHAKAPACCEYNTPMPAQSLPSNKQSFTEQLPHIGSQVLDRCAIRRIQAQLAMAVVDIAAGRMVHRVVRVAALRRLGAF